MADKSSKNNKGNKVSEDEKNGPDANESFNNDLPNLILLVVLYTF